MPYLAYNNPKRQQGATLIVALLILLVMTLTAVTSMQTTTLEEKMVSNSRDYSLAFEAAEIGLRTGENWLSVQSNIPIVSSTGGTGVWTLGVPQPLNSAWWAANAVATNNASSMPNGIPNVSVSGVASQPQFYVEELSVDRTGTSLVKGFSAGSVKVYHQVTAVGRGTTNNSMAILQSTFVRRYQ